MTDYKGIGTKAKAAYGELFTFMLGQVSQKLHDGIPLDQVREWIAVQVGRREKRPERQLLLDALLRWAELVADPGAPKAQTAEQLEIMG